MTMGMKAGIAQRSKLLAAVSHPIRVRAMTILNERVASPNFIAKTINLESNLEVEPGLVSYHVKALVKAGLAELVETAQVRGATEHFYRAMDRVLLYTDDWAEVPEKERREWSEHAVSLVIHDAVRAFEAGTFDSRADRYLTRLPMKLDEQGWEAMSKAQDELLQRAFDIQAESDERRGKSGEEAISAISVMATFEAAPGGHWHDTWSGDSSRLSQPAGL